MNSIKSTGFHTHQGRSWTYRIEENAKGRYPWSATDPAGRNVKGTAPTASDARQAITQAIEEATR